MRKTGHERQTVARAAAVVMVVTVLSKLLGFGRVDLFLGKLAGGATYEEVMEECELTCD
ncbi:MAG: hypothetical protein XD63_1736, partial [Thermoanaerobacterales bacterium 50_218]